MHVGCRFAVTAACGAITLGTSAARAARLPHVVIHVVDYAHATSGVLVEAQYHVTRVFGIAGVRAIWRDERTASPLPSGADHVSVIILSQAMSEKKRSAEQIPHGVLGSAAPPPGRRAWIFLDRIEDEAARRGASAGAILGHVIAHEVAHTIANLEHSPGGIMQRALDTTGRDFEGFSTSQAEEMRAALRRAEDQNLVASRVATKN